MMLKFLRRLQEMDFQAKTDNLKSLQSSRLPVLYIIKLENVLIFVYKNLVYLLVTQTEHKEGTGYILRDR